MSALSSERPAVADSSLSASLERWLGHVIEIPAAALVLGEVAVLLAGLVMRFVFNSPIPWADELASILFLWLANLGAAVALRRGTHMRTTVLIGFMSERGKAWAEALAIVAPCLLLLILIVPMWEYAEDEMFVRTPALGWPNTVRAAAVATGAALMIAISLLRISRQRLVDFIGVAITIAVIAGAMYLSGGWLQSVENWNLVIFFGLVLGVSVLMGIPIAFCFGLATVAFMLTVTTSPLAVVAGRFDEGMSSLILLAVPLFILLGHLVEMTGMAKAMVDFLASLLGHVRGGLNYVLLGAMLLVSGISGAKTADMAAVAPVLLPEMKRRGNHEGELISLLAASGAMAETIPPSLVLITIGSVAGVSIAALFTGGIMPGIVLAALLAILVRWRSAEITEGFERAPGKVVMRTLLIALPALLLPMLIRTAVVEGVATATEVSTIGIVYAVVAGLLVYRQFDWKRLYPMLVDTAALSGAILFIIGTATGMSWALTQSGFSHSLAEAMTGVPGGKYGFLLVSIAAFVVLGSVLEGIPAMVLFAPLLFPVAKAVGVHEVHYAMVIILSMGVGLFAPPFGLGYYAACTIGRVHPDVAVTRIWPYLGALVVGLLIIAFVPWFSIGFL